ncbi:MAG: hypothetical protein VX959_03205 [Candidatus Thermoplasmatota archaeon]|nr:hypothetical protein [Candidatus Thermoplasmatota archaeon]
MTRDVNSADTIDGPTMTYSQSWGYKWTSIPLRESLMARKTPKAAPARPPTPPTR